MLKIAIILFSIIAAIHCLDLCGDWTQYKHEKCLKVLPKKATHSEALEKCMKLDKDSSLVTINNMEEQQFIVQLIAQFNHISMNAWIGMEFNGRLYNWTDGTNSNFTNWSEDAVREGSEPCVKMSLMNRTLGKWTDSSCKRQALIVCQKKQILSLNSLKGIIEEMLKTIDKQKNETKGLNETNVKQEKEIKSLNTIVINQSKVIDGQNNSCDNKTKKFENQINSLNVKIDEQNKSFNTKTEELENTINSLLKVIGSQQKLPEKPKIVSKPKNQILKNENNTKNEGNKGLCPLNAYDCGNGICIAQHLFCDGDDDCGNGADEKDCKNAKNILTGIDCPINHTPCKGATHTCIPNEWICDGVADCPNGTDEHNCNKESEIKTH